MSTDADARQARKIFIVEDQALIVMLLEDVLTRAGHVVCGTAGKPALALAQIPDSGAEIVLMDINLGPGPSGIDVALELGPDPAYAFVFLSAYPAATWESQLGRVRGAPFLNKPVEPTELLRIISRF